MRVLPGPPFSRSTLRSILSNTDECGSHATANWLLQQETAKGMRDAVAAAWRNTGLSLACWAEGITAVEGCYGRDCPGLVLRVSLSNAPFPEVFHEAPLTTDEISDEIISAYIQRLPTEWQTLAKAAPGLVIEDRGPLCSRGYARSGLWDIARWLYDDDWEGEVQAREWMARHEAEFVGVIAEDGIGNSFVLGHCGGVFFFDHESDEDLKPIVPSARELLEYFLEMPDSLFDDEFLGLA